MALTQLAPPYPIFTDKNGDPLDNGYLYFGEVNKNPETNPIQVYYDSAFTQPAAQPLRTSNGYVMRNGSPALIYADSQFSVTIRDKNNALVIYSPVGYGIDPGSISGTVVYDDFTGDGSTVVFSLSASPSTKNATNVYIDGVYQSKDNYSTSGSTLTFTTAPPLNSAIEVVTQESSIIGGASSQQISYTQGGAGAVTRTVQSRLRDFVSVKDFGAVGDGVTDDTAAIQAALSASSTVFIPDGNYLCGNLSVNSGQRIYSTSGVLLQLDNTVDVLSLSNVSDIVIDGLTISSTRALADRGTKACISILNSSSDITVKNCVLEKCGAGIFYTDHDNKPSNLVFEANTITDNRLGGISGAGDNVEIFNNIIENNGYVSGGLTHNVYLSGDTINIFNNVIGTLNETSGNEVSLYLKAYATTYTSVSPVSNVVISNNVIRDGMSVRTSQDETASSRLYVENVNITDNDFYDGGQLTIIDPLNCVFSGNIVKSTGRTAMITSTTNGAVTVLRCRVFNNVFIGTTFGFGAPSDAKDESTNYILEGNQFSECTTALDRDTTSGLNFYGNIGSNTFKNCTTIATASIQNDYTAGKITADRKDLTAMLLDWDYTLQSGADTTMPYDYDVHGDFGTFQVYLATTVATPTNVPIGAKITYYMQSAGGPDDVTFPVANGFKLRDHTTEIVTVPNDYQKTVSFVKMSSTIYVEV